MTQASPAAPSRRPRERWEARINWRWLYPGVRLKRWLFLFLLSGLVIGVGLSGLLGHTFGNLEIKLFEIGPLARQVQSLRFIDFLLLVLGAVGIVVAFRRGLYAVATLLLPPRPPDPGAAAFKRLRLRRGPKLVAIGGGTGLPLLLTGLKDYTANLSAIVTMADDGGSSGRLRREYQALPPGDLRNCLIAMAETGPLMNRLFQHRFQGKGAGIEGHSFGNLFITALAEVTGDFGSGIKAASQVLAVSGQVLPVTLDPVVLEAELEDGTLLQGESRIGQSHRPIRRLRLVPADPRPAPDTREAIAQADVIVLGPGSLYTSILPNLLVPGILDEIADSRAVKIYVCNVMTQPGETDGMSVADHLQVLLDATRPGLVQYVLANTEAPSRELLARYAEEGAQPVIPTREDAERLDSWDVTLLRARLATGGDFFRHDPTALARVIMKLVVI